MNKPADRALTLCRFVILVLTLQVATSTLATAQPAKEDAPDWSFNATIIEACSCPMFCQCYFNTKPAGHCCKGTADAKMEHFCRFNRAFKVNTGSHGATKLEGVKFWMAGDLGGDFSNDQMDWAELTYDPSVTKQQRDAIAAILHYLYPVKWNSFTVAKDAAMEWKATPERAEARLDRGKTAEMVLRKAQGMSTGPVMIKNLKYDGAPRNDGFILMPNEIQAYKVGKKAFEFKGTTGFMITIDMKSKDVKK